VFAEYLNRLLHPPALPAGVLAKLDTDVTQWDEAVCGMVTCQHPQCWDTLKRTEEGHPQIRLGNSCNF